MTTPTTLTSAITQKPVHAALDARLSSWQRDQHIFGDIAANGGFAAHMEKVRAAFPGTVQAAIRSNGLIVCADERVNCLHEGSIADAGSTLLHDELLRASFLKESGATAISWHTGCAAAGLAFEKKHGRKPDSSEELNRFAEEETLRIAKAHDLEFVGRIDPSTCAWQGDHGAHYTRTLYWVVPPRGKGWGWSPNLVPGLPTGFTIMAGYCRANVPFALEVAEVLVGVALGNHGYGELISKEHPFHLVVVANAKDDLSHERERLRLRFPDKHFVVDGFLI